MADETSEEPTVPLTWSTRFMNTILCRGDLSQEKLDAQPVSISELIRYATFFDKILLVLGMIIAIILGAIHPLPVIVEGVIANIYLKDPNHIGNDSLLDQSLLWCEIVAGVGVISATLAYLQSYFLMRACSNIVRTIRREFVKAVLHQEAEWFDGTQAGAITAKLNDNVERIRDGMADKVGLILRGFSMFTSSAVFSFIVNWRVTLVCIGIGPLGAITMSLMARLSAKPMRDQMEAGNEAAAVAEEAIMNVKTVAACNGQKHMVEKYKNIFDKCRKIAVRTCLVNGFCEGFLVFQMYLFFTAGLVYGIIGFFNGDTTEPGSVIMAANAILVGAYFLSQLGPHMMAVLKARVAAAVIYKIIDRKPSDVSTLNEGLELTNCEGRIKFSNVHFKYPTRDTPVLNGCSWTAEAGEMIAFVGHSGCGKSTSICLITRLYAPTYGNITIDEVPIEQLNVKSLRKVIGIVSQEPCLFNGTIKENIVLDRTVTDEMVEEAAKTANAHGFIEKLENGYNTVLGVGGVSLSGGQKQRIAIARAIVTKPKILILDEATSALDSESERIVQLALNRASKGRTTIMIAHRLSTLRDVQRIHVMEGGIITEIGNHLELCTKGGLYASLAKAQQVGIMEKSIKPEIFRRISESLSHKDEQFHDELSCEPFMRSSIRASGKLPNPIHNEKNGDEKGETEETNKGGFFSSWTFIRLYFATGKWTWQMWATIVCVILRTVDMPSYSYLSIFPYLALQSTEDDYMHYVWLTLITYSFMAFYLWFFIGTALGFGGYSAETLVNRLRVMCLKNLLQRDAAYFDEPEKSNAQCVTTISLHTPPLQACFDYRFIMICNNVIAVFFCLVVAFVISWQIGVTILVFISISGILFYILTKVTNKCMARKDMEDKTPEFALEIFEQARTIQLLVAEDYFSERYTQYQDNAEPWETKLNSLQSLTFSFTLSFLFFSEALFYAVGVHCIYIGAATAAVVFVAVMAGNMAGFAVIFASPSFNDFMKANASANALFKLIGNEQTENNEEAKKPLIEGSLSVENVEFAYPTRPDTLVARDLSLSASNGQSIALVGASGCGKSTIIQLIERFYEPLKGNINVDGTSIQSMSLHHLRENIALVGQEPVLFKGSIRENIMLGCENMTFENVRKVAEMANAAHFIENLPQGYETDVGEKGKALSGGQKQRIAIARALIRNPKILLLDEATSALDTESEEKVQVALNEASTGRTSITIAHRLSTIKKCDRIFYIENGSVLEAGTHDELLSANGKYAKLVEAQTLDH